MIDVLIKGGQVIDGSGGPRRRADIAIEGDTVAAIGAIEGPANLTIEAEGRIVCPGFVDVHTHYDAQAFWDSTLSPSPLHGVTTAICGNCGFSIAPLGESDAGYMMRMLARVEGISLDSLATAVSWDWRSMGDYLDRLDGTLAINTGFMVGHSAIRRMVMGDAATSRQAEAGELDAMISVLDASLAAGAIGFSSSWARTHNDGDGNMVPSRYADETELLALAEAVGRHPGTSLEFIPGVGEFEEWQLSLMARMSAAADRHLNWNLLKVDADSGAQVEAKLAAGDYAERLGGKVIALTVPMPIVQRLSFATGFVLDALPGWRDLMLAGAAEKLSALSSEEERRRLRDLSQESGPLRYLTDWSTKIIVEAFTPETKVYEGRTVGSIAIERAMDPFDALCEIVVADGLQTIFTPPVVGDRDEDWAARASVWQDQRVLIGASDAGAHLDLLATFHYPSVVLAETVRKRPLLSFEQAIRLMTIVPAATYGLGGRGLLRPGWKADVVVIDPDRIGSGPVHTRSDLPGGGSRLYSEGTGYEHVLVNGQEIVRDGQFTDVRPGTVLRSGRDSYTAPARRTS